MTGQIPPLPAGYKLEQPQQQGGIPPLPPGYSLETSSVTSRPSVPRPSVDMQGSYAAQALSPTESVAGPGEASYVAQADPQSQSRMLGAAAIGAGGAAAGANPGAAVATARALAPIAKRYGIKALEGAGLGLGWHLYKELKGVFEP